VALARFAALLLDRPCSRIVHAFAVDVCGSASGAAANMAAEIVKVASIGKSLVILVSNLCEFLFL
jgi:hypothetical protein